jgi:hypothetical protein
LNRLTVRGKTQTFGPVADAVPLLDPVADSIPLLGSVVERIPPFGFVADEARLPVVAVEGTRLFVRIVGSMQHTDSAARSLVQMLQYIDSVAQNLHHTDSVAELPLISGSGSDFAFVLGTTHPLRFFLRSADYYTVSNYAAVLLMTPDRSSHTPDRSSHTRVG